MKRLALLLAATAALASGLAAADDRPAPAPEVQDLVFLGEARPVHVRLHLFSDGKPFPAVWDEFMRGLFEYLDRNGDGVLTRDEAERAPRAQNLKAALAGNFMTGGPGSTATMAQLDANRDGKVTQEELTAYYRRFALTAFQVNYTRVYGGGENPLTEALFRHLDTNKDGVLSREEVQAAAAALAKLDLDDDECISPNELVPNLSAPQRQVGMMGADGSVHYLPREAPFALVDPADPPRRLADQILARYDRNKDQHLSREEIGLDKAAFDQLDANKDGRLDATELAKYLTRPPDLELRVQLVKAPAAAPAKPGRKPQPGGPGVPIDLDPSRGAGQPLASAVRKGETGGLVLDLGDSQVEFHGLPGGVGGFADARRNLLEQFKGVRGAKDYIDKGEADRSGIFGGLFRVVDRDGDGKITQKELEAYLDLMARGAAGSTVLSVSDHGRMLFDLLDANRDGRLGPRELRNVWERLAPWDRNGDGHISRDEIPRRFQLTFSQGQPGSIAGEPEMVAAFNRLARSGPSAGPLWFRKMDRNGDGDISPREWLGRPEDFKRIDTNGDGLIDAQEAERYDATLRKKAPGS
jgi:Ca2+-binding EF-hand superfamily protein